MALFRPLKDRQGREEAEAYFDRFVAAGPARLAWFLDEVERETGRRPEATREDLIWLEGSVVVRLTVAHPAEPPVWFHSTVRQ